MQNSFQKISHAKKPKCMENISRKDRIKCISNRKWCKKFLLSISLMSCNNFVISRKYLSHSWGQFVFKNTFRHKASPSIEFFNWVSLINAFFRSTLQTSSVVQKQLGIWMHLFIDACFFVLPVSNAKRNLYMLELNSERLIRLCSILIDKQLVARRSADLDGHFKLNTSHMGTNCIQP